MKKMILTSLIIFLTCSSGFTFAVDENNTNSTNIIQEEESEIKSFTKDEIKENIENESKRVGERVETPSGGSKNISFTDGYNGYCINKGWNGADRGDDFIVKNTSMAKNSINHEYIGNYLKILFVDYHDFAVENADETAKIVWNFTDRRYWESDNEIIQGIIKIAESGRVIADHSEVKRINETTEAIFNFEVLDSVLSWHQNFFGYKITYRTIPVVEENDDNSNKNQIQSNRNPTQSNNSTLENQTQTDRFTSENQTQTDNSTLKNQTNNNTTDDINSTPEIKQEKTVQNNTVTNTISDNHNASENNEIKPTSLEKYVTGYSTIFALFVIFILGSALIIKFRRD